MLKEAVRVKTEEQPARVSAMAERLVGSEILKIAADIRAMIADGKTICNLTVGDFSSKEFRIPEFLEQGIIEALRSGETNYPPSDGMMQLKKSVLAFYKTWLDLDYPLESVLITGGSRPGIYGTYRAIIDPGDIVVYPVPSWNNNHYCHQTGARGIAVPCTSRDAFLPTRALLEPHVRDARLLALNSPLNPTGTAFTQESLEAICDLVLEENLRRSAAERPLFLMYDQVYWMLTFGATKHFNPVGLRPALKPYTIFVDGISKPFAATGVRVGWVVGPQDVVQKMSGLIGHVGAWAPRAEQVAVARLLEATDEIVSYHREMKHGILSRLDALYEGINGLQKEGLPVAAIAPMGAIYLSAKFDLIGKRTQSGEILSSNEAIRKYVLNSARLAVVPFQAFGMKEDNGWFRLSVGAVSMKEIEEMLPRLKQALVSLRA